MAEQRLTVEKTNRSTGLEPTWNSGLSTEDTYLVRNSGRMWLHFQKTGAGDCTVAILTPRTYDGMAVADREYTVAADTGEREIGPFPQYYYNNADGDLKFTVSDVTGLSVAVVELG